MYDSHCLLCKVQAGSKLGRKEVHVYLTTHPTHFIHGYMEGKKEMFYLTTHSTHFIHGYMEGRKEMFYLTTHSTHFIHGYMEGMKEMFYLTTHSTHFILRLYGVGHMVKDYSDSERGNPLPPHGLLFPINNKGSRICTIPQTG